MVNGACRRCVSGQRRVRRSPQPNSASEGRPDFPCTGATASLGLSTGAVILVVKPEQLQCHGFLWGLAASHGWLELSAPARSKNRRQNGRLHSSSTDVKVQRERAWHWGV
ncbi:uncharacterized protein K441DRAFT_206600 [Cenococcum geophilum 1.58]|uniref:uncharacterized protein n=1 Tax=Cenococcum geophilum 1.58 TaxID=794803 RepID=UPI00358FDB91|nr:hypothetical protein K441DRAFT_206600 [Cenococcum geophilum 1.58]